MIYLRVLLRFFKANLMTAMEYRVDFLANALVAVASALWTLAALHVFFMHRPQLGGWRYQEALIVAGLFIAFEGVMAALFRPNLEEIPEAVRQGTLDFILLRPLDSQFLISFQRMQVWHLTDILLGLGIVAWALAQLGWPPVGRLLLFGLMLLSGLVIFYSLLMILITLAFWFVEVENIIELIYTFFEAGRFPVTAFPTWVRIVLTFIVPIAFLTTVPAQAILGWLQPQGVLSGLLVAMVLLMISRALWRYALRHYTSAGG
ncbi:MAG: ABC-2 family transporter protein [Anaerolineae bacterium]|nr:ABC-2 family transporter protein [Thermoflexus sp.]MDW8064765.1 ABC-2 family transporter protein [Anaerolineae bacterium]